MQDIPVFGQDIVGNAHNVCGNPAPRAPISREPSMDDDEVPLLTTRPGSYLRVDGAPLIRLKRLRGQARCAHCAGCSRGTKSVQPPRSLAVSTGCRTP